MKQAADSVIHPTKKIQYFPVYTDTTQVAWNTRTLPSLPAPRLRTLCSHPHGWCLTLDKFPRTPFSCLDGGHELFRVGHAVSSNSERHRPMIRLQPLQSRNVMHLRMEMRMTATPPTHDFAMIRPLMKIVAGRAPASGSAKRGRNGRRE